MVKKKKHYEAQLRVECRGILKTIKSKGCSICGYNKCVDAIDFHHIELKNRKDRDVGRMVSGINSKAKIRRIIEEVSKCIILCANCHRELHSNSGDLRNNKCKFKIEESSQINMVFMATA